PLRLLQLQGRERRRARALHADRARAARIRIHLPVSPDLVTAHLRRLCALRAHRVAVPQAVSAPHARRPDPGMNRALRRQYLAARGLESWTLRRDGAGGTSTPP